jgi:hypothetical protein
MKTKKQIESYVKKHKGQFVGVFTRNKKEFIYFQGEKGKFTGYLAKDNTSIKSVQRYNSFKVKVKVRLKNERGKKTISYNVYNLKQRDNLLFRMNKKLRDKVDYKAKQRNRELKDTNFQEDAVPYVEGKKKIDLLFDKYKFESVKIEEYIGRSP